MTIMEWIGFQDGVGIASWQRNDLESDGFLQRTSAWYFVRGHLECLLAIKSLVLRLIQVDYAWL